MTYLSITFPESLKRQLDEEVKREGTKRSTFIQKAVRMYLDSKARRGLRARLKEEAYAMHDEALQLLKDFKHSDHEALKHVP